MVPVNILMKNAQFLLGFSNTFRIFNTIFSTVACSRVLATKMNLSWFHFIQSSLSFKSLFHRTQFVAHIFFLNIMWFNTSSPSSIFFSLEDSVSVNCGNVCKMTRMKILEIRSHLTHRYWEKIINHSWNRVVPQASVANLCRRTEIHNRKSFWAEIKMICMNGEWSFVRHTI